MAASAQQDAAAPSAEVVGHAFALQYYTILHQSPTLVYRFYQDISKLGRLEENGEMGLTTTMEAINQKIQSYGNVKADIKSVDAQESYNSGVIVLITGDMIKEDDSRQRFTQTFFLAPQDKGYFVLNDILRYVEDNNHHNGNQDLGNGALAPTAQHQADLSPVQENHNSDQAEDVDHGEVYNTSEDADGSVIEEEEAIPEVVDEVPNELQKVVESNPEIKELPKKSYAAILKHMKEGVTATPSLIPPKPTLRIQEQKMVVPLAQSPTRMVEVPVSSLDVTEDGNNPEVEAGAGLAIYLKNLPMNATPAMVEETFKRFGPIKNGGIQVRGNKGSFGFGFVEFEVVSSAQSAIEASPIIIGGRQVVVEEKKSTNTQGGNRGRFPPGRGGGFRNERGNYGGGRGYGQGDSSKNEFGNRGSSRGYQNRSNDGYERNDQMVNGGGRMGRGGVSAVNSAAAKSPRVAASA
ncbi:hypothetical protein Ancab_022143 [Ancistrocladus abbreviatus]